MNIREYGKSYALSAVGAANLIVAGGTGAAVWLGAGPLAGSAAAIGAYALVFALALLTGLGPRAAAAERERRAALDARGALELARRDATRLAALRLPAGAVRDAVALAGLKASSYVAACARSGSRDPRAEEAIRDCLELADAWLKELDDQSTEKRFGQPDDDPFAGAEARVLGAVRERVALLDKAILDLDGGLGREDRVSIKEQL